MMQLKRDLMEYLRKWKKNSKKNRSLCSLHAKWKNLGWTGGVNGVGPLL